MAAVDGVTGFSEQRILVMGFIERGFGDISATVKILDIMKRHVPLKNLALTLSGGAESYHQLKLFKSSLDGVKIIDSSKADEFYDLIEEFSSSLVILFHGMNRVKEKERLTVQYAEKPPIHIPAIVFEEYNYSTSSGCCYSLGIHADRYNKDSSQRVLGIFQDAELVHYYQNPENQESLHRLKVYTSKLHQNLCRAVIGDGGVEAFDKENVLYFGYSSRHGHKTKIVFLGATVHLTQETQKNVVVVLAGGLGRSRCKEKFRNFLKKENFGSLEFVSWDEKESVMKTVKIFDLNPEGEQGKNRCMRIINGDFSHDHFIQLMLAAEREVLCTGDQSLGEALSAGKKIYYETLGHKQNLADSLCKIINRECSLSDVSFHYTRVLKSAGSLEDRFAIMKKHYDDIDPNWDKVIEHIHQDQNCEERIIAAVADFFINKADLSLTTSH